MIEFLLVGAGGIAGAIARHLVGTTLESTIRSTLTVNVGGSLALGALVASAVGEPLLLALGVGFCGAFTTFSSFVVETVRLAETGEHRMAAVYAVGMALLAIGAIFAGGLAGTLVG